MADEREPLPLALIICDGVHVDSASGKRTLLGLFSVVMGPRFPITLPHLWIFAAITDCLGKTSVEIRIVDAADEREPVIRIPQQIDFDDPLAVQEMSFFVANVTFPESGEYRVQLYAGGSLLLERRLMALERPRPTVEEHDNE